MQVTSDQEDPNKNPVDLPKPDLQVNVPSEIIDIDYWQEMIIGIRAIVESWTAIQLAVENGWGGRNSVEKVNTLVNLIVSLLDTKPDIDNLLNILDTFPAENFSVILEDDSATQVGEDIWEVFCTCAEGDNSVAQKFWSKLTEEKKNKINTEMGLIKEDEVPQLQEVTPKKKKSKKAKKPKISVSSNEGEGEGEDGGWTVV